MTAPVDVLAVILAALALSGCAPRDDGRERELICETHGEVTERHVGVKSAIIYTKESHWTIHYVDGDGEPRYYTPRGGETCALETIGSNP